MGGNIVGAGTGRPARYPQPIGAEGHVEPGRVMRRGGNHTAPSIIREPQIR